MKYDKYKNTNKWNIIEKAIIDLENNNDILLQTSKKHIIGYICAMLDNEIGTIVKEKKFLDGK